MKKSANTSILSLPEKTLTKVNSNDNMIISPSNSKPKHLFVAPKKKKTQLKDLGLEYDKDVTNDSQYLEKIFQTNSYHPSQETLIDIYEDVSRIMDGSGTRDKSKLGAVVGMTVLSVIGFLALSFTIIGGIAGGVLGLGLGRYAGRKLKNKIKKKGPITQEELFITKLECLIKLGTTEEKFAKENLNKFRIILEKIIEETSLILETNLFSNQKKIIKIQLKLRKFFFKVNAQKALLLSYKLFKLFFKQSDLSNIEARREISSKMENLFTPYKRIMELKSKKGKVDKKVANLVTYKKVVKLFNNPDIFKMCEEFPDLRKSELEKVKFKDYLQETVDLQQKFNDAIPKGKEGKAIENVNIEMIDQFDAPSPKHSNKDKTIDKKESFQEYHSEDLDERSNQEIDLYQFEKPTKTHFGEIPMEKAKLKEDENADEEDRLITLDDLGIENLDKSSSDSGEEDDEEEAKLMEDSALYQTGKTSYHHNVRPKPSPLKILDLLEEENDDSRRSTPLQTPKRSAKTTERKRYHMTTEDIDTKADPLRTRPKPDIVRLNSFSHLSISVPEGSDLEDDSSKSRASISRSEIMSSAKKKGDNLQRTKLFGPTKREITFQKILTLSYDEVSKWEKICQNEQITIQKIKPENSPVVLIRAWAFIKGYNPLEVFNQIYNTEERTKWDTITTQLRVVDKIDDKTEVIYFLVKAPFGVSNRDFVQMRDFEIDYPQKGQIVMSFISTTHPSAPPIKGNIRAETHIAGYLMKPSIKDPNSTDLCILSQVDIKGSIPRIIVNTVAGRAPAEWVRKLEKACEAARNRKKNLV